MHMPPDAASNDILKRESATVLLWARLAPERWPLPLNKLPQGTALVGGAVRDGLLNRLSATPDLDLVVPQNALGLTRRLAQELNGTCVVLDADRDMARLVLGEWTVDLSRREGADLNADLQRRDYTVNAIALPLHPRGIVVDPSGGLEDLQRMTLRAIQEQNLIDDPLRLLRGLRFMAEQNLSLDPEAATWIHRHRHRLPEVAPERILSELQRLVCGAWAAAVIPELQRLDLLAPWQSSDPIPWDLPDTGADADFSQEERQLAWPLLRLTHLVSEEGLKQLRSSRRLAHRTRQLRHWLRCWREQINEAERLQLQSDLEEDLPAFILTLPQTDRITWLRRWRDPEDKLFHPRTPLNGRMLQEQLGLVPGPSLGVLIDHLRLEYAFGRIVDQDDALQSARHWLTKNRSML
tara:strand:- start:8623 stop:9846 length:1224 start_codon:yes stop_codon:yes gene_type:complete